MAKEKQNPEEILRDAEKSSSAIITLPEKIITITFSVIADGLEIFAALAVGVPVIGFIGWVFWAVSFFFGFSVSIGIFIWSMLRGVNGSFFIKRALILLVGFIFDEATLGILPIRTPTLIITIWLNNHFEQKKLTETLTRLEGILKIVGRYA